MKSSAFETARSPRKQAALMARSPHRHQKRWTRRKWLWEKIKSPWKPAQVSWVGASRTWEHRQGKAEALGCGIKVLPGKMEGVQGPEREAIREYYLQSWWRGLRREEVALQR